MEIAASQNAAINAQVQQVQTNNLQSNQVTNSVQSLRQQQQPAAQQAAAVVATTDPRQLDYTETVRAIQAQRTIASTNTLQQQDTTTPTTPPPATNLSVVTPQTVAPFAATTPAANQSGATANNNQQPTTTPQSTALQDPTSIQTNDPRAVAAQTYQTNQSLFDTTSANSNIQTPRFDAIV